MKQIFAYAVLLVLLLAFGKLTNTALSKAKEDARDRPGGTSVIWYLFVMIAAVGIGVTATRSFWHSIPRGDMSFGGLVYFFIAPFVFFFSSAIGGAILALLGTLVPALGRLGLAAVTILVLSVVLIAPMRQEANAKQKEARASEWASYQAKLAQLEKEKEKIPHAPPDTEPDMLGTRRDYEGIHVTNLGNRRVMVRLALVLPTGQHYETCSLGVEERECGPGSGNCSYYLAKDGTQITVNSGRSFNHVPEFAPNQTRIYAESRCEARFRNAPIEFQVWDKQTERYVFKSDSAFVPDPPSAKR